MEDTVYICGNPHSHHELEGEHFQQLEEVWKYAWDDSLGTLPARPVTDRAINIARDSNPNKMALHYMQPHCPFINYTNISRKKSAEEFGGAHRGPDVWTQLQMGEVTKKEVWEGYKDNLHFALDDIEILLKKYPNR